MRYNLCAVLLTLGMAVGCGQDSVAQTQAGQPTAAALQPFLPSRNKQWLVQMEWTSGPPQTQGVAAARLTFFDNHQALAQQVTGVDGHLYMPSMTHPPVKISINNVGGGPDSTWDAAGIKTGMDGTWDLYVEATVDNIQDTVDLLFDVP